MEYFVSDSYGVLWYTVAFWNRNDTDHIILDSGGHKY